LRRMKPEAELQRAITTAIASLGYVAMESGKSRSKVTCRACGAKTYATGWQGNTPGLPDIYVHHPDWFGMAVGLELKGPKTAVTPVQQSLADAHITTIVRTVAEALHEVRRAEATLGRQSRVDRIDKVLQQMEVWNGINKRT